MLKLLRNQKLAKKILIGLAIIIIPAFVFWGFSSVMRGPKEYGYAGRIFGKNISALEFKDAVNATRNNMLMRFGDKLPEIEKFLNLENQAWERLILAYEAKKRKLDATDKEVVAQIEDNPFFWKNGKFDKKLYEELIHYVFHTQPRVFEEQTRQNLLILKLYEQVTGNIKAGDDEIKEEYRKLNEEISLYYIAGLSADFAKGLILSDEEIKVYFNKNSLEFKQPLSFNLEYLTLDSEAKTREVISGLNKKRDFGQTAREAGLTVKETGLFNQTDPIPGIGWAPEISNLISKLAQGQFSPPIRSDKYYYILRLKERKEPYIPEFQKLKDKVKERLMKESSTRMAKQKIEDCLKSLREITDKPADFDKAAKEFGLKSGSTNAFKYGSYIEGIGASDNFWTQAQGLKEGDSSQIISLPDGFYIIRVKSKTLIDEKKFAEEKKGFGESFLLQKKEEYFRKFLEELKKKAL